MKESEFKFNFANHLTEEENTQGEVLWFSVDKKKEVQLEIDRLKRESVNYVRLGIDCTEFNSMNGDKWFDWLLPEMGEHFELELCLDNFSRNPKADVLRKNSLHEIVEYFILRHGKYFTSIELWRNRSKKAKPEASENIFAEDVVFAATWAKHWGKNVVFGGIQTMDFEWVSKLSSSQFFRNAEFVEINREKDRWNIGIRFCGSNSLNSQLSDNRDTHLRTSGLA